MDYFSYKNNRYFCEETPLEKIALHFGTPAYIYSERTIVEHIRKLKNAFIRINPLICYSVKANSNLSILRIIKNEKLGFDIVSGGELYRLKRIGVSPEKIVFAGVGKTKEELEFAVKSKILMFNVESISELRLLNKTAEKFKRSVLVALRINPDVDAKTHRFITTGKVETKFGIPIVKINEAMRELKRLNFLEFAGLHIHIGSQITKINPYLKAIDKILKLKNELKNKHYQLKYINIGGGLGIIYDREKPLTADKFAGFILEKLSGTNLKLIMEPGRFIVGNAGVLLTRVTYIKKGVNKWFLIVDAGMNDLIRPCLYNAYHNIYPLNLKSSRTRKYDVVGPVCETTDFFAKERTLPVVEEGDFIAVKSSGAYGFSMASRYNSRRLPAEVLVTGKRYKLIGKRERFSEILRRE